MVEIFLENLSKYFGEVKAVDNLTLRIKDKEFITLLGPSGCGKTTTLRLIAGLEKPTKGNIYINGYLVNDLSPKDRNVALVFQNYALYPNMNVFDNIAFPLKMHKVPKNEIRDKVIKTARLLKIEHLLNRKPKELSGGEQQRVALGRALVREPNVFLMDEPLSNLDAKLRVYMRAELKTLQRKLGITTIYVTHDQVEAMAMSDRIAIMNKGRLQQVGSPSEIYDNPLNSFVAGFIGSPPINLFDCSLIEKDGKVFLVSSGFQMNVSNLKNLLEQKGKTSDLILGIRPEDVLISEKRFSKECIRGKILLIEPLGAEAIIDLSVGENTLKIKEKAEIVTKFSVGQKVWLLFNKAKIHIFDKKTGKTIV